MDDEADRPAGEAVPEEPAVPEETAPEQTPVGDAGRSGWWLLAGLAVLAATFVTLLLSVDIQDIVDDSWRQAALLATGVGLVFLGAAFVAVLLRLAPEDPAWSLARSAMIAAVVTGVGAIIAVGLAREQGGTEPPAAERTTIVTGQGGGAPGDGSAEDQAAPDEPVPPSAALDPDQLTRAALPVDVRTSVTLELNRIGRRLAANAGGCRPDDYHGVVLGIAIGGTWAQPLLLVAPPINARGNTVRNCDTAILRLPLSAGVAVPG